MRNSLLKHISANWQRTLTGLLAVILLVGLLPSASLAAAPDSADPPTGDFELAVAGTTGWNGTSGDLPVYLAESATMAAYTMPADVGGRPVAFMLLEDNGGSRVKIRFGYENEKIISLPDSGFSGVGWVDKDSILINLPDVLPSAVYNLITYSGKNESLHYLIAGINQVKQYSAAKSYNNRLGRAEYIVPCSYPLAQRLARAQKAAASNGDALVLKELYRPAGASGDLCGCTSEHHRCAGADLDLTNGSGDDLRGYCESAGLTVSASNHQHVTAPDTIKTEPSGEMLFTSICSVEPASAPSGSSFAMYDLGGNNRGNAATAIGDGATTSWTVDSYYNTFLRFSLVAFNNGVDTDMSDHSNWWTYSFVNIVPTSAGSAGGGMTADKARSSNTLWYNSNAMIYNLAGNKSEADSRVRDMIVYDASGGNAQYVVTDEEFMSGLNSFIAENGLSPLPSGVTSDNLFQYYENSTWGTWLADADYTSMWGQNGHDVIAGDSSTPYKRYESNAAFLYLLHLLTENSGYGAWTADEAIQRWNSTAASAPETRTMFRIIVEPGFIVKNGSNRFAFTVRDALATGISLNTALVNGVSVMITNAAAAMFQSINQFVEYPEDAEGIPTGEKLWSANGFKEAASTVSSATGSYASAMLGSYDIFSNRYGYGLHILTPFAFESEPLSASLEVTKKADDSFPSDKEWGMTVTYTSGSPDSYTASKTVTETGNGLKFTLRANETIHIDFEADSSFRFEVTEDDSSNLTNITTTGGGTADMAEKKFTSSGGASKVTFTNGTSVGKKPVYLKVKKIDATTKAGLSGAEFSVYADSACSGTVLAKLTTGSDGTATASIPDMVDAGGSVTLYVKETKAPAGGYNALTNTFTVTCKDPDNTTAAGAAVIGPAAGIENDTIIIITPDGPLVYKRDAITNRGVGPATFKFSSVVNGDYEFTTDNAGNLEKVQWWNPTSTADGRYIKPGEYTVTELLPPPGYQPTHDVQQIKLELDYRGNGIPAGPLVFKNAPKKDLTVLKVDTSGKPLAGASFKVYKDGEYLTTVQSNGQGKATITDVSEGYYEVEEITAPDGFILDSTKHGVYVDPDNLTVTEAPVITVVNEAKCGLKIVKYDRNSHKAMVGVTFEVFRDSVSIGQYETNAQGEILLTGLQPGTYRAVEIDTGDDSHILDPQAQEVELTADGGTIELVFFNDVLPGMRLIKVDSADLSKTISGAKFRIEAVDGSYGPQEFTTGADGSIDLSKLPTGAYVVTELECPGYVIDHAQQIIHLDANETAQFVFTNSEKPTLKLIKTSSDGSRLKGITFRIAKIEDGSRYLDRITDANGEITVSDLKPGVYSVLEIATDSSHVLDPREYHVELFPGKTSTICIENQVRPNLIVYKHDADTGEPIPNTVFIVRAADGHSVDEIKTDATGKATLANLLPGVYEISEKSVPSTHLLDAPSQLVTLYPNRDHSVYFKNHRKPTLTVLKVDSASGDVIRGAEFHVWYGSNNTTTGEINDLGSYQTDSEGLVQLTGLNDGWYKVQEVEAAAGYSIKDTGIQELYLAGGVDAQMVFENVPLSAIVVWKFDSITGTAISGATFQVRYLGGESGTGGTVVGTYKTGINGSVTITGLKAGSYVVEEISSDSNHVIDTAPQTVFFTGQTQDIVQVYFGNTPKGSVLVRKIDAITHIPLSGVEFQVVDSTGAVVGTGNGKFTTDSSGSFLVENLDPGTTLVVKETKAKDGYILDQTPQTVMVKPGKTVTLEFVNQPKSSVLIVKKDASTGEVLSNVEFLVTDTNGNAIGPNNGKYTTDSAGTILIDSLTPGMSLIVRETRAKDGYILDSTPQAVVVKADATATLEFRNTKSSSLLIVKKDAADGKPLSDVEFLVTDSGGCVIGNSNGRFVTDSAGTIRIDGLTPGTSVVVRETRTKNGYVLDNVPQTAKIKANEIVSLEFRNQAKSSLLIVKKDAATGKPLPDVEFYVTNSEGTVIGNSNGRFVTDSAGTIRINDLDPGMSVIVKETKAKNGYVLDHVPQTAKIKANEIVSLEFLNQPAGTLIVEKKDSLTGEPLAGVEFKITTASGEFVPDENGRLSSNGLYTTDSNGQIKISGVVGTLVVTETRTIDGYVIDPETRSQTVVVDPNDTQTLTFFNIPKSTLTIHKYATDTLEPLAGVKYLVTASDGSVIGNSNGIFFTDAQGQITIDNLVPGTTVTAREIETVSGYTLEAVPQSILVKEGEAQSLVFGNTPLCNLTILKRDSLTRKPLANAQFLVTDQAGVPIGASDGHFTTGINGIATITGIRPDTVVTVREEKAPAGYVLNTEPQTIVVQSNEDNTLTFENEAKGTLIVKKVDSATGKPLAGAQFKVTTSGGELVANLEGSVSTNGMYSTDTTGSFTISGLEPDTYVLTETKAPDGYVLDATPHTVKVTTNDTQTITITNTPLTGLILQKYVGNTTTPIPGAVFLVTDDTGAPIGTTEGEFTTDANGRIVISGLTPGMSVTAREIRVPDEFVLDSTPKSVKITEGASQTLTFRNDRKGTLVVQKTDKLTGKPLAGVEFFITYADGSFVDAANGQVSTKGLYKTDAKGEIRITNVVGTLIVKETAAIDGYVIDPAEQSKTVVVNANDTQTLHFTNIPKNTLVINKYKTGTTEPIAGVKFQVTASDGSAVGDNNGVFITDAQGQIVIPDLTPGVTITAKEIETVDGYDLEAYPQSITIQEGAAQSLIFGNKPLANLTILKQDRLTKNPLAGARFLATDQTGAPVGASAGHFVTGEDGQVTITGIKPGTAVTVREEQAPTGYSLNPNEQTIVVQSEKDNRLTFENDPLCTLTIQKADRLTADPLAGAQFLVTDQDGAPVGASGGHFTTGSNGRVTIDGLTPGAVITVREEKAPAGYVLNPEPQTITVQTGKDNLLTFENDRKGTLIVVKVDSATGNPLVGAEFKVTTAEGKLVANLEGTVSTNGLYTSDNNGSFTISGLEPGSFIITETKAPTGYVLNTTPVTVQVDANDTQTITIKNTPLAALIIQKYEGNTTTPIPGAAFLVTDDTGAPIGTTEGEFTTDANGRIVISGLTPGMSVTAREIRVPDEFVLDSTPKSVKITEGASQTLTFRNDRKGTLVVQKTDKLTGNPLAGVEFFITYADGSFVDAANGQVSTKGLYKTDAKGEIRISNIVGTLIVKETAAIDGYVIDPAEQSKTVVVNANDTQTLHFTNIPKNTLVINKYKTGTTEPIAGVKFQVTASDGSAVGDNNGVFITDAQGQIVIPDLTPGVTITAKEIETVDGYDLEAYPQSITIQAGEAQSLIFGNKPLANLTILKLDRITKNPLAGARFLATDQTGAPVGASAGHFVTGEDGQVTITGIKPGTAVTVREEQAPAGYSLNPNEQTIVVQSEKDNRLTFENDPLCTLTIQKVDRLTADPLAGAQFLVTDQDGAPVGASGGHLTTSSNGRVTIDGLTPGAVITVREEKAPAGYVLNPEPQTITVQTGKDNILTFANDRKGTLIVVKVDSETGNPLAGAEFKVTTAEGKLVANLEGTVSTNGLYTSDKNGSFTISDLEPGSFIITETKAPTGYVLNTTPVTVQVDANDTQTITIKNTPLTALIIQNYEGSGTTPVAGSTFLVTDGSGAPIGLTEGEFTTDAQGRITINGLVPGTSVNVREIRVPDEYILDGTPKSIQIKAGEAQTLTFRNDKKGALVVQKTDKLTGKALAGVEFFITYADGSYVDDANGRLSSKGIFKTDANGEIRIINVVGTLIVKETRTIDGYVIDAADQSKTVVVNANDTQTLHFTNIPKNTLVINKYKTGTTEPIAGVRFLVTASDGSAVGSNNGIFITDTQGQIVIPGLTPGVTITAKEIETVDGYDLEAYPQSITIQEGAAQSLIFDNKPLANLTILAQDRLTKEPLPGTRFLATDQTGAPVGASAGKFTTGEDGQVTITGIKPGMTVTLREEQAPAGYVLNLHPQTITVQSGKDNRLTFENDALCNLTIRAVDSKSGKALSGVQFLVTDRTGAPVGASNGHFTTDHNGSVTIDGLTPGASVTVREEKAPAGYVLNPEPQTIVLQTGRDNSLTFENEAKGTLIVLAVDSKTNKPIPGVEFKITTASGELVANLEGAASSNGMYLSDENGEIRITGLSPNTYIITETRAATGYILNTQPTTVEVKTHDTQTIRIYNDPQQALTIQKFVDGTTIPIKGVTFLVTDSSGALIGPNNGEFTTDRNGRIVLDGLTPGTTITAKEVRAASGYVLDAAPQSILIRAGEAQTLTFFNKAEGGLELIKVSEADKSRRIPGVTFEIRKMDGALVDTVTTDKTGRVHINLDAGDYYAVEIEAAQGFKLDESPNHFTVKDGATTTLTVTNKPYSGILIHKTDALTGKGISGVTFLLYNSGMTPIGQYTTDNTGYAYIEDLTASGRYYLRELSNEGYIVDTELKTVYVTAGETSLVEWKNTPVTAQIQILKKSADYNSTNGLPAGTPLEGAVFEIYDKANNVVDTFKSDSRGLAVSRQLPLGRYTVKEVKAPANYGVSDTVLNAYLEHSGQIVTFEVTNKSLTTGVSITKTGPKEVMAGQPVRYAFSGIANASNVRLDSFYWRDTLPAEIRLDTVITGTYNYPGSYKIVYRVNGGEYETLADNLSTSKNYTLAASAAALGLASNERVTEIMFVFGQAPAGFAQVEKPYLHCTAVNGLPAGSFVNKADVGGTYNGVWVQAVSRWVTTVYGKPVTLPRTGY